MAAFRIGLRTLNPILELAARPVASRLIHPSICSVLTQINIPSGSSNFHTCAVVQKSLLPREPKKWPLYNDIVYPPRGPEEPRRPAEVFHYRADIKYSYKKLWYIAVMIRGMSVDEAKKQLSFMKRAGSEMVKESKKQPMVWVDEPDEVVCLKQTTGGKRRSWLGIVQVIEEAQDLAVDEHNVEYRSNMWIAESFVGRARIIKGMRKHAGLRFGTVHHRYTHYFLCLREGPPPKHYTTPEDKTGHEYMADYLNELRGRGIRNSL